MLSQMQFHKVLETQPKPSTNVHPQFYSQIALQEHEREQINRLISSHLDGRFSHPLEWCLALLVGNHWYKERKVRFLTEVNRQLDPPFIYHFNLQCVTVGAWLRTKKHT